MFKIKKTDEADKHLRELEETKHLQKRLKAVRKTLGFLEINPRHPSLRTHKYETLSTEDYEVFEAYAENKTPGAYRVFWRYGPGAKEITIIAITSHP
ncbi:MAG: uncharacterized protein K0R52_566 [Alphaproteobacteria bacterium]|jgi:hypothetical protein|nr:uncharacterized protein [Alphaproteobacteria bacterium]